MKQRLLIAGALCALLATNVTMARGATIIDSWNAVKAPTPPPVTSLTIDRSSTALLVLDFVKQICAFPDCQAVIPTVSKLIASARAAKVPVIYSLGANAAPTDILTTQPLPGDPVVSGRADKFIGTTLDQALSSRGIKTVIVTGVAGNGAALYTASHAAMLGMKVIVPIDTIPTGTPYAAQFTVWQFPNMPGVGSAFTLTTAAQITF